MHSLTDLYNEASDDLGTIQTIDYHKESFIKLGVMLNKYPNKIELINTTKGGDYFKEFTDEELIVLTKNGWRRGVILLSMMNYKRKLLMIENRIQDEMNTRKNDKYIKSLKISREKTLKKYSAKQKLLNKLDKNG